MRYPKTCVASVLLSTAFAVSSIPAQNGSPPPVPAAEKATAGQKKAPSVLIAVVDMEDAAAHTKAFKEGRQGLERMRAQYKKLSSELSMAVNNLKLEIELLKPSPERFAKELERETLIGKQRLSVNMYTQELERMRTINDDKIYVELSEAVSEIAARRGILLVLRKRPHITVEEMVEKKMVRAIDDALRRQVATNRARSVIYHAPELDLTEDLIKYLKAK